DEWTRDRNSPGRCPRTSVKIRSKFPPQEILRTPACRFVDIRQSEANDDILRPFGWIINIPIVHRSIKIVDPIGVGACVPKPFNILIIMDARVSRRRWQRDIQNVDAPKSWPV